MDTQRYDKGYEELLGRDLPSEGVVVNKSMTLVWRLLKHDGSSGADDAEGEYDRMSAQIMSGAPR